MKLDRHLRVNLEELIDELIDKPKDYERVFSLMLRDLGIEPNLETVLSFIIGWLNGISAEHYRVNYNRSMNKEEVKALINLLKRRAWELRQAFISTRIKEE